MSQNPFTFMFGKEPKLAIRRQGVLSEIINEFSSETPASQVYILTGARGVGKTVLLSEIYQYFTEQEDWVAVDVNPHRNILEDLASSLYEKGKLKKLFLKGSFDISFQGISFHLSGSEEITSIHSVIERMFSYLKKHNKKILITMDEVISNENVREFAHDFQSFARENYPVFLLMTGLYENVMSLQNDKSLTFLYRAPKVLLGPLDLLAIKNSYKNALNIDEPTGKKLAELSKGYGFGYQLLGHLFFEHPTIDEYLLEKYDESLRMNAYEKIYFSLSQKERGILNFLCIGEQKTADIMEAVKMQNNTFSVYRDRLLQKGVVMAPRRGYLELSLPRFDVFLKNK